MAKSKELRALIVLAGKIDPSLQSAMLRASGESLKLSKNVEKSTKGMSRVWELAKGSFVGNLAANAVSRLADKVYELGTAGLKMASDLNEVQNVVDVTFGQSASLINDWSKNALKNFGLSDLMAKQYTGTMGAMLKSSGIASKDMVAMSQNLAGLAGDYASFYNLDHDMAWEKIRSGISGETEPLKQLGINMSVANLEAYALSKGITTSWNAMDQASQTLLRYNYLMDVSNDAQGDFTRTNKEYANQQRQAQLNLQQLSATILQKALPYLNKFYLKANEFMTNVDLDKAASMASIAFNFLGNSIKFTYNTVDNLLPLIAGIAGGFIAWNVALKSAMIIESLRKAWAIASFTLAAYQNGAKLATLAQLAFNGTLLANPIFWVVAGIGLLIAGLVLLWKNWDKVTESVKKAWEWLKKVFGVGDKSVNYNVGVTRTEKLAQSGSGPLRKFAGGGIASRPSIFGDAGPEIAIPLQRSQRSNSLLEQASRILGFRSGGGSVIHLMINVDARGNTNGSSIASSIKEAVTEALEEIMGEEVRVSFG